MSREDPCPAIAPALARRLAVLALAATAALSPLWTAPFAARFRAGCGRTAGDGPNGPLLAEILRRRQRHAAGLSAADRAGTATASPAARRSRSRPKDGTPVYVRPASPPASRSTSRRARPASARSRSTASILPTDPSQQARLTSALQSRLPCAGITVALDQLQTNCYAAGEELSAELNQPVDNAPPGDRLHGDADAARAHRRRAGAEAGRRRCRVPARHEHAPRPRRPRRRRFLEAAGYWYRADRIGGSFAEISSVPASVVDAAKAAERAEPRSMLPEDGKRPAAAPAILIAAAPTELIQTKGTAEMQPVAGTSLLTMANADHAVFMDPASNQYYRADLRPLVSAAAISRAPSPDVGARRACRPTSGRSPAERPQGRGAGLGAGHAAGKEAAIAATIRRRQPSASRHAPRRHL